MELQRVLRGDCWMPLPGSRFVLNDLLNGLVSEVMQCSTFVAEVWCGDVGGLYFCVLCACMCPSSIYRSLWTCVLIVELFFLRFLRFLRFFGREWWWRVCLLCFGMIKG